MRINVRQDYAAFLRAKLTAGVRYEGDYAFLPTLRPIEARDREAVVKAAPHLHEYQRFALAFALARERVALFLECGLGKTSIAIGWAEIMRDGGPAMVSAPLAAAHEFEAEQQRFYPDVPLRFVRTADVDAWLAAPEGIAVVTHHAFVRRRDLTGIRAFVLDESSILKSGDGAIATALSASCAGIDARLALSATPAPNDPVEYAAHATWLGYVRSDAEFRARWFVRDGKFWRIKGHAKRDLPEWLSSWAIWMRDPDVYGMPCDALPPDHPGPVVVPVGKVEADVDRDLLGMPEGMTMGQRAGLKRELYAAEDRLVEVVRLAQQGPSVVWCIRNAHADACERALAEAGVRVAQIAGSTKDEERVRIVRAFQAGKLDCIVSKPKVIGHGVNLQRADVHVFAGYDESYEAQHQALRRSHRQGRVGELSVYMLAAPEEQRVVDTLTAKRVEWMQMADKMQRDFAAAMAREIKAFQTHGDLTMLHETTAARLPEAVTEHYRILHGDTIIQLRDVLGPDSVDLAVFSPPFSALFTYSSEREDMGNCSEQADEEFGIHFAHFCDGLLRVMKPGRAVCLHLQQVVAFRARHGRKGLRDFRGLVVRRMEESGFHYYGEFVVPKNPQAAAIRTKSERLQFAQFKRDSLESSPCLNDYVLHFRKPGKQAVRVHNDVSNDEWIKWASGLWNDIRETDVLEGWQGGRAEEDEKHVCPLQLETIRRCVRLWSNPGEVVMDPFMGIGSTAYVAIEQKRQALGVELKTEYFRQAVKNAALSVERHHMQRRLAL